MSAASDSSDGNSPAASEDISEKLLDLEVKLAYQDRLIRELDAHVRELGDRLVATDRELKELKETIKNGGPVPLGAQNEKPPHY